MSEHQQISFFVKYNLKTILKLLAPKDEDTIDLGQLEGLSILFKNPTLFLAMFQNNKKYDIIEVSTDISERIYLGEWQKNLITGLTRSVQIKDEEYC